LIGQIIKTVTYFLLCLLLLYYLIIKYDALLDNDVNVINEIVGFNLNYLTSFWVDSNSSLDIICR